MANVLEQIQAALNGNDATVRVEAQAGNVLAVGSLLGSLSQNPPQQVSALTQAFGSLDLPEFPLTGLVSRIADVRAAMPADTSGILRGTLSDIATIEAELGGALATSLRNALVAFEKVKALADIDLRCAGADPGASSGVPAGDDEDGGGAPPAGPPAPAADQPTGVAAAAAQANAVFDRMPAQFNLRALLKFLHGATTFRRTEMIPAVLPFFDDLRDPLDTLIGWEALTPEQLLAELAASLQEATAFVRTGVESTLAPLFGDLASLLAAVPAADLTGIAERITIRLVELRAAVQAGDVSGTAAAVTEINTRLDEYDTLRPALLPMLGLLPGLRTRLNEVAADLDLGMASMLSILKPGGGALTRIPQPHVAALDALLVWLQGFADWLNDLASALDLSAVQAPIATVSDGLRTVADGLQQGIITVTLQAQAVFSQVQSLLDTLDPHTLQEEAEAAVQAFRGELIARVDTLVGPARDAVMQAVQEIDQAVDAFDPGDVVAALSDAIDALAAVLGEGEIGQAIAAVHDGLEAIASQLASLSFTPTTDAVVDAMDDVRAALEAIDPAMLPDFAVDALKSATSVLPPELEPITDPILDGFGQMVDSGPAPILEQVRDAPKQLIEAVRNFNPESLIGTGLAGPFREVVRELEDFRPSDLLKPVERELDAFKERLRNAASPGQAAQALQAPFDQLRGALNGFDPDALVEPLDSALSTVTERLFEILPTDEAFGIIDQGLAAVQRVLGTVDTVVSLMRRLREAASALADARGQLEAWVSEVLDRADAIADTSSLTPLLEALRASLDGTRASAIAQRFTSGTAGLRAALDQVNGTARLAALVQAHRAVPRAALQALPASAEQAALQEMLDRFDPLLPEFGAPWQQFGELHQALRAGEAELQTLLVVWDERFHAAGGSLDTLRQAQATPAQLRAWAQEALQTHFIEPVAAALGFLDPAGQVLDAFLLPFEELVVTVRDKLAALLLGPQSLNAIRTSLGQIADLIQGLDLEFLRTSLNGVYQSIREKLDELSPQALAEALDQSFAIVLNTITIDLVLPPADLQVIDEAYAGIVEKLRLLDPSIIVTEVVKPLFEEKVVPLIDKFDISPSLEIIIEKLGGLDDELREEIGRVNEAYVKLLAAVPAGGSQSASISVAV